MTNKTAAFILLAIMTWVSVAALAATNAVMMGSWNSRRVRRNAERHFKVDPQQCLSTYVSYLPDGNFVQNGYAESDKKVLCTVAGRMDQATHSYQLSVKFIPTNYLKNNFQPHSELLEGLAPKEMNLLGANNKDVIKRCYVNPGHWLLMRTLHFQTPTASVPDDKQVSLRRDENGKLVVKIAQCEDTSLLSWSNPFKKIGADENCEDYAYSCVIPGRMNQAPEPKHSHTY